MSDNHLIVSDPPQPAGDLSSVAPLFNLAPVEVRMKANYGIPEIWFADAEESSIAQVAEGLSSAGLNFAHARGSDLRDVPAGRVVESFAFQEHGVLLHEPTAELQIRYDAPIVGVFCQPKGGSALEDVQRGSDSLGSALSHSAAMLGTRRRSSLSASQRAGTAEEGTAPFFDLYVQENGELQRLSVFENLETFVTECSERFTHARMDRRLVGMRIRQRSKAGVPNAMQNRRKGLTFAGPALPQLLRSISPGLEEIHQAELSSRLVYLTAPLA
jgi:hypothetical protein